MSLPAVSNSEWTVMEYLWEESPQTAAEVIAGLRESTGWAPNTVRTLLTRLVEKGALRAKDNEAGVREYAPAVKRDAVVRAESKTFLQRVFRGAEKTLLAHFAANARLTPEEVKELKRLLDENVKPKP
ncbi:BlaI/MecI/CopY family transcriptional regulator [Roseimicrobium gellanilyticum]|nr:BlaI/MecI/CopY family transcriptional regulator [Roseimicrobium gellanilyticum]